MLKVPTVFLTGMEVLLGAVFVVLVLAEIFRRRKDFKNVGQEKRTNKDILGPPSLPFIGILHYIARPGTDYIGLVQMFVLKYGKILRTRILLHDIVALFDPVHIEKVLKTTNPGNLRIPAFMSKIMSTEDCSKSLLFANDPIWKRHKKVLSRLFTQNGIENQIKLINRHSKNLVQEIFQNVDAGVNFSVVKMLHRNALHMILDLIFDSEMLTGEERTKYLENLRLVAKIATRRLRESWLLIPPVWWLHPLRRQLETVSQELKKVTLNMTKKYKDIRTQNLKLGIDESENENEDDEIGIKRFKCAMELMVEAEFDEEEIFQEAGSMILAGHDTNSWSITYLLFNLARHPEIQERCRNEVDRLFEGKKLLETSNEEEVELTVADLNSLEYLDRCVKENLRLAPIVFGFIRELEEAIDIEENFQIDSGTIILFSPWITHRDPKYYPEPETFDPDRFLPEEVKKRHPYAYIPFSGGIRNCIAFKSAPLTIKLVTAYILRNFVIETTDKWEDLEFVFEVAVTTKKDINFILKSRVDIL